MGDMATAPGFPGNEPAALHELTVPPSPPAPTTGAMLLPPMPGKHVPCAGVPDEYNHQRCGGSQRGRVNNERSATAYAARSARRPWGTGTAASSAPDENPRELRAQTPHAGTPPPPLQTLITSSFTPVGTVYVYWPGEV